MFVSRVLPRVSRSVCRSSMLLSASQTQHSPALFNQFHSLVQQSPNKVRRLEFPKESVFHNFYHVGFC
ncbi:hypothetical protein L6164_029450 [Bauhinia variegata]|uniref:Uncharacterized protein n=1 Tax=Bauhinia variegata TaxID=167791 RepID=A0ACB9LAM6_BAUVA|nr:hypothetical protein L6164_029450 [Bauhinia variegata]